MHAGTECSLFVIPQTVYKMKLLLLLLAALALTDAKPSPCKSTLPFLEVCAYGFCYLNINQADMEFLNCERKLRALPPLEFIAEGKCSELLMPKCKTFNY